MLRRRAWALAAAAAMAGCAAILDVGDVGYGPAQGSDAGDAGDGANEPDATTDSASADGGADADVDAAYGDFREPNRWESAVLTDIGLNISQQWTCGFFDGARVVYVPRYTTYTVAAFDVTKRFDFSGSWTQSPIPTFLDAGPAQTTGCAFDGARVYVTLSNTTPDPDYVPFQEADGGWSAIDLSYLDAGTYHGRPVTGGNVLHLPAIQSRYTESPQMRVDTSGLPMPPAVAVFSSTQIRPTVHDYVNALFDGRYLYLVPHAQIPLPSAARVDTTKALDDQRAWEVFDVTALTTPAPQGFQSATFDGRYVYLWGDFLDGTSDVVAVRYDTTGDFQKAAAWEAVDLRTSLAADGGDGGDAGDAGETALFFAGSTFDGRYVYALANGASTSVALARFDTRARFVASSFDYAPLPAVLKNNTKIAAAVRFAGLTFDGRYVYLGPYDAAAARVDIKSPPALPPTARATFY